MTVISFIIIAIIISFIAYSFIKKFPVSQAIVIANFCIFIITLYNFPLQELAFKPSYLTSYKIYTIFTSMFLHGDFFHIFFNMIGLIFIGFPLENEIGAKKFLFIYITSGFFATVAFSLVRGVDTYLIGASGAIFGILGAFASAYPFKKVVVPLVAPLIFFIRLPVIFVALFYAFIEILYTQSGVTDGIAHTAHLGGFITGVFLSPIVKVKIEEKEKRIDWDNIEKFLENDKQKEIFEKAKNADEKELRDAWLSYLLKKIKCPKCGGEIKLKNGAVCSKCGYRK
ncbi:MAG TPA: rhomboid family intramembrane serine protease [Thermoplasmatales archaeon]|nr:rhomboid family intramembrane serine protease [Thermoplasmatales archaeon]